LDELTKMKLYQSSKIDQILNSAIHIAYEKGDELEPSHFASIDMLHYMGSESLSNACEKSGESKRRKW